MGAQMRDVLPAPWLVTIAAFELPHMLARIVLAVASRNAPGDHGRQCAHSVIGGGRCRRFLIPQRQHVPRFDAGHAQPAPLLLNLTEITAVGCPRPRTQFAPFRAVLIGFNERSEAAGRTGSLGVAAGAPIGVPPGAVRRSVGLNRISRKLDPFLLPFRPAIRLIVVIMLAARLDG